MTNWLIELKDMTQEQIDKLPQSVKDEYGYNLEEFMDEAQSSEESESYYELMQKLTRTPERQETEEYKTWASRYNAAYHDYGKTEKEIIVMFGPEPEKYELTDDEKFARDFPHAAAAHAVYLEVEQIKREAKRVWDAEAHFNHMCNYDNTIRDFEAGTGRM